MSLGSAKFTIKSLHLSIGRINLGKALVSQLKDGLDGVDVLTLLHVIIWHVELISGKVDLHFDLCILSFLNF